MTTTRPFFLQSENEMRKKKLVYERYIIGFNFKCKLIINPFVIEFYQFFSGLFNAAR